MNFFLFGQDLGVIKLISHLGTMTQVQNIQIPEDFDGHLSGQADVEEWNLTYLIL